MISLQHLTKRYGRVLAVDGISLAVPPGEIFGFLGPNGAGKTTTIRMMAGLLLPTAGSICIDGWNIATHPAEAKQVCGFIPDRPFLYAKLTGREFLRFSARLYGMAEQAAERGIDEHCALFHMQDYRDDLIESYSHGMKQRLVMAAALLHRPKVIIVDEPMVGLDPKGAKLVKEIFRDRARTRGTTIFMSTHTLEIAEEVCDRIGIIQSGRIIAVGAMDDLRRHAGGVGGRLEELFFRLTGDRFPDDGMDGPGRRGP
jgi:ABC-2 type transport system ATP-binding protein